MYLMIQPHKLDDDIYNNDDLINALSETYFQDVTFVEPKDAEKVYTDESVQVFSIFIIDIN